MKLNPEKLPIALIMRADRCDSRYGHMLGYTAQVSTRTDYGFDSLPYGYPLENIRLHSQTSEGNEKIYGYEIGVSARGGSHVTLNEAERHIQVLRPIEAAMRRMSNDEGYPASYGQWVNRVARAIGAGTIFLARGKPAHNGTMYERGTPGYMVSVIQRAADELVAWSNELKPHAITDKADA